MKEIFLPGTVPTQKATSRVVRDIDQASGLLWQDGCVGPKVTKAFFDVSEIDAAFPNWHKADRNWAARAARGPGVRGTRKGTRTAYFYNGAFAPFGRTWGAPFAPTKKCPLAPPPTTCDPLDPTLDHAVSEPAARGSARRRRTAAAPLAPATPRRVRQNVTIVAPSPPSPRSPGRTDVTSGWSAASRRTASRRAPVPRPWMTVTRSRPASDASSVEVAGQRLERLLDPGAAQVERRRDGARPRQAERGRVRRGRRPGAGGTGGLPAAAAASTPSVGHEVVRPRP